MSLGFVQLTSIRSVSMMMSEEKKLYRAKVFRLASASKISQRRRWELLFFIL